MVNEYFVIHSVGVAVYLVFSFLPEQFINPALNRFSLRAISPSLPIFNRLPGADNETLARFIGPIHCFPRDVPGLLGGKDAQFFDQRQQFFFQILRNFAFDNDFNAHNDSFFETNYCPFSILTDFNSRTCQTRSNEKAELYMVGYVTGGLNVFYGQKITVKLKSA